VKTDALATLLPATKLAPILKRYGPPDVKVDAKADGKPTAKAQSAFDTDPIATLVHSFLLWESNTTAAAQALARLREECVDFNELRVCLPEEIVGMLGSRYPFADERANRLRRSLNDIYRREHRVSFDHAMSMGKREQKTYVENLDGMVPFVAARLLLLHFGQAAIPVDEQLAELFRENKIIAKEVATVDLAHALAKQHHSLEDAARVHAALVGYADGCWEKDPKAMMKNKSVRIAAQQAAERAARKEAERIAAEAARAAEAAAKAEAERIEAAKAAARAQARAEARARAAAAKAAAREAAQREAAQAARLAQAAQAGKTTGKVAPKASSTLETKKGLTLPVKTGGPKGLPTNLNQKKPSAKAPLVKVASRSAGTPGHSKAPAKVATKPSKPAARVTGKPIAKANAKPVSKPAGKQLSKLSAKPAAKSGAKQSHQKGSRK
jgi:hypothetical protein